MVKYARTPAVAAAILLAGTAACASTSTHTSSKPPAATTAATSSAPAAAASPQQWSDPNGVTCDPSTVTAAGYCPGDDPVSCDTVLDPTGWANGPLTEVRAIAIAAAVADTEFAGIVTGTVDNTGLHLLDDAASEMESGISNPAGQLGTDAQQFVNDEKSFNPGQTDFGPEDTAYSEALSKDIIVLVKDCPHAYKLSKEMAASG